VQAAGARAASLATGVLRTSLAPLAPAPASKAATTHLGCQMSKWGAWGGVAMLSVQTQQGWCGAPCIGFCNGHAAGGGLVPLGHAMWHLVGPEITIGSAEAQ